MRCLALAQHLQAEDIEVTFIISQTSLPFCQKRHDWVGKVQVIPEMPILAEIAWLKQRTDFSQANWIVLDGYQFTERYRRLLKDNTEHMALFDDNNDSGPLYADLVINGAGNAQDLGYQYSAPEARLCVGQRYRVLRREFLFQSQQPWQSRKDLVVTLGGSDPLDLTLGILSALQKHRARMPIRVITGAAYPHLTSLRQFVSQTNLLVQHLHDCQQMADVFSRARLVISAAGGSQYELQACATPSVLLVVADNQQNATEQARVQGWCETHDGRELDCGKLAEQVMQLWKNDARLQTMHKHAAQSADTQGAERVVTAMLEELRPGVSFA
ncbi:hypothetical protein GCM10027098_29750 [Bowmanella dokdonensis]